MATIDNQILSFMPQELTGSGRAIQITKKNMPADVYRLLLKKQSDYKNECGCQVSLERTIYKIIRNLK